MDRLSYPVDCPQNFRIARRLHQLDAAMRRPDLGERAAVNARIRFFETAIRAGVHSDTELNALADLFERSGSKTWLSERSYNCVFEDGEISDKAVIGLVRMADQDPSFEQALIDAGYKYCLPDWRAFAAKAVAA